MPQLIESITPPKYIVVCEIKKKKQETKAAANYRMSQFRSISIDYELSKQLMSLRRFHIVLS